MALGPNHGNPFIEGDYPCTDRENPDYDCEDCPINSKCTYKDELILPEAKIPFPGARVGKSLSLFTGRVLLNATVRNNFPTYLSR